MPVWTMLMPAFQVPICSWCNERGISFVDSEEYHGKESREREESEKRARREREESEQEILSPRAYLCYTLGVVATLITVKEKEINEPGRPIRSSRTAPDASRTQYRKQKKIATVVLVIHYTLL